MMISNYGWNVFFTPHFAPYKNDFELARILRQDRTQYQLATEIGVFRGVLTGKLMHEDDPSQRPVVGDWVVIHRADDELCVIHAVLPRKSTFSRKTAGERTQEQVVAANIDTLFLMMGLDANFNLRRIERYVVQARNGGATPVILLNKADLCGDLDERIAAVEAVAPGVAVHAISALHDTGLEALRPYLRREHTVALLGSSGVGKSTLVNQLLEVEVQKTAAVRADDQRGRHTTTHRELFLIPGGGILIDTPGMRELQLWTDGERLDESFSDIEALAARCRFADCSHQHEPGCAVREALETGELDEARLENYFKMGRELAYLERRQRESGVYEERQRGKKFGKMVKAIMRHHPKRQ